MRAIDHARAAQGCAAQCIVASDRPHAATGRSSKGLLAGSKPVRGTAVASAMSPISSTSLTPRVPDVDPGAGDITVVGNLTFRAFLSFGARIAILRRNLHFAPIGSASCVLALLEC